MTHLPKNHPSKAFVLLPTTILLIACSLLIYVACNPIRNMNILSTQDEVALGAEFDAQISKEAKFFQDRQVVGYIEELTQRLARVCKRRDLTYRVKVIDTDVVNAFAVPGGYLYVNLGLIRAAKNEAELAGVMGHEIAHVVARHGAKRLTQQYGLTMLVKMATGTDPTLTEQIAGVVLAAGGQGLLLKYGREDELEADALGVQNLYDAGIDPNGLPNFFLTLMQGEKGSESQVARMLSTHPPTKERIVDAQRQIVKLPPRSDLKVDTPPFQRAKSALPAAKPAKKS